MTLWRKARGTGASFQIASYQTVEEALDRQDREAAFVEGEDEADHDRHEHEAERERDVAEETAADEAVEAHRRARP